MIRTAECLSSLSVLLVADVVGLSGIEGEVADRSNETVDTEGDYCKEDVSESSRCVAFGLEACVVDDDTTDPTEEKCQ